MHSWLCICNGVQCSTGCTCSTFTCTLHHYIHISRAHRLYTDMTVMMCSLRITADCASVMVYNTAQAVHAVHSPALYTITFIFHALIGCTPISRSKAVHLYECNGNVQPVMHSWLCICNGVRCSTGCTCSTFTCTPHHYIHISRAHRLCTCMNVHL